MGIPTVRDRVVQGVIVNVIEPIFERNFAEHSYGFRPQRGCKDALRRVDQLLKAGYTHVVDADLKGSFDSIPHDRLMARLETKIADGPVLRLIEAFLKADNSLQCIVRNVNRTLRGWFEYFQHSSYRNVFQDLDGWTRMRLRSILRKRAGRRGRGLDHQRWPNRYFAMHGLFSLATAHALVVQSSPR